MIPKIIYHMETYEAELICSDISNWLLTEWAGTDVKTVSKGWEVMNYLLDIFTL